MAVLLGILRGAGIFGDQSDATYQQSSAFDGTVFVPVSPTMLGDLAEAPYGIERVEFYGRVSWWPSGGGPLLPSIALRWRVGAFETVSDALSVLEGVLQFSQIPADEGGVTALLQPNGQPWTLAAVNDLRMRASFYCDSHSSGEETFIAVAEFWAKVWGPDPPPPPPPPDAPASDTIRAAALRSGNIHQGLRAGGIRAPLRSVTPTAALRSGNLRGPGGPA